MRGNVDTRLRKLAEGQADALVLAAAGLARLGLAPAGAEPLAVDRCTPAPGQGCLAIEGRRDRPEPRCASARGSMASGGSSTRPASRTLRAIVRG